MLNYAQDDDATYQDTAIDDVAARPARPASDADEVPAYFNPEAASLNDVKTTLKFIDLVRNTTLDNGSLDEETIYRLRNPI